MGLTVSELLICSSLCFMIRLGFDEWSRDSVCDCCVLVLTVLIKTSTQTKLKSSSCIRTCSVPSAQGHRFVTRTRLDRTFYLEYNNLRFGHLPLCLFTHLSSPVHLSESRWPSVGSSVFLSPSVKPCFTLCLSVCFPIHQSVLLSRPSCPSVSVSRSVSLFVI